MEEEVGTDRRCMHKRKKIAQRKVATIKELSELYGVNRNTMAKRLSGINLFNIMEVLRFVKQN